jgi:hypothetical protein
LTKIYLRFEIPIRILMPRSRYNVLEAFDKCAELLSQLHARYEEIGAQYGAPPVVRSDQASEEGAQGGAVQHSPFLHADRVEALQMGVTS